MRRKIELFGRYPLIPVVSIVLVVAIVAWIIGPTIFANPDHLSSAASNSQNGASDSSISRTDGSKAGQDAQAGERGQNVQAIGRPMAKDSSLPAANASDSERTARSTAETTFASLGKMSSLDSVVAALREGKNGELSPESRDLLGDVVATCTKAMENASLYRSTPEKRHYFGKLKSFCVSEGRSWKATKRELHSLIQSDIDAHETTMLGLLDREKTLGRVTAIQEAAEIIRTADGLGALGAATAYLAMSRYLTSGEMGIELHGERASRAWVLTHYATEAFYCASLGGCGNSHPVTLDFCLQYACSEGVSSFQHALYQNLSPREYRILEQYFQFIARLRAQGVEGLQPINAGSGSPVARTFGGPGPAVLPLSPGMGSRQIT